MAFVFQAEMQRQDTDFSMRTVKVAMQATQSKIFDFANASFVERDGDRIAMSVKLYPHSLQGKTDPQIKKQMEEEMVLFLAEMPKELKIAGMRMSNLVKFDPSRLKDLKLPIAVGGKEVEVMFEFKESKA